MPHRSKRTLVDRLSRNLDRVSPMEKKHIKKGLDRLKADFLRDLDAVMRRLGQESAARGKARPARKPHAVIRASRKRRR